MDSVKAALDPRLVYTEWPKLLSALLQHVAKNVEEDVDPQVPAVQAVCNALLLETPNANANRSANGEGDALTLPLDTLDTAAPLALMVHLSVLYARGLQLHEAVAHFNALPDLVALKNDTYKVDSKTNTQGSSHPRSSTPPVPAPVAPQSGRASIQEASKYAETLRKAAGAYTQAIARWLFNTYVQLRVRPSRKAVP